MGKSFVIKDCSGRAAGYMMKGLEGLSVKVSSETGAQLTVFDGQGQTKKFPLQVQMGEQIFPYSGTEPAGAYVSIGERLLGSTGKNAEEAFEKDRLHHHQALNQKRGAREVRRTETEKKTVNREDAVKPAAVQRVHTWPQRRWPPPACVPGAHYESGEWKA